MKGEPSERRKEKIKVKCYTCGTVVEKLPCYVKDRNFCSKECTSKWRSEFSKTTGFVKSYINRKPLSEKSMKSLVEKRKINTTNNWKNPDFIKKATDGMKKSAQERWSDSEYKEEHSVNMSEAFKKSDLHKQTAKQNLLAGRAKHVEEMKNDPEVFMKWFEASTKSKKKTGHYYSEKNHCELYYHLSWELKALEKLEKDDNVKSYDRCHFSIPYMYENKKRRYIPDFLVTYQDGSQEIIEVKPKELIPHPKNLAKAEVGREYCLKNNMNYVFWSKSEIFGA